MVRHLLLALALGSPLASCHVLGGFDALEARDDDDLQEQQCNEASDCPGLNTVCRERLCTDGLCSTRTAPDGSRCLDSTCERGECIDHQACDDHDDCLSRDEICDPYYGLCRPCTQPLCDMQFPGTTCSLGLCLCETGLTFCPGYGCVDILPFAAQCGTCEISCANAGCVDTEGDPVPCCVDPYGSAEHCGGCGNSCGQDEKCVLGTCVVEP